MSVLNKLSCYSQFFCVIFLHWEIKVLGKIKMKIYQQSGQASRLDMGTGVKDSSQPLPPFSPFSQPPKSFLLQRNNQSDNKTTELYFSTVYPTNLQKLYVYSLSSLVCITS